MKLALKKLLQANPSIQVSTLLSGSLSTPSAKGMWSLPYSGYNVGTDSSGSLSTVLKFNFYSQTSSTLTPTLSAARSAVGHGLNATSAGYFAGGSSGTSTQAVDKLTYSTESLSTLSNMGSGRNYGCSIHNEGTAGYAWGGEVSSPLTYFTDIAKLTYSGESWSTTGSGVGQTNSHTGGENGSSAGYHFGGFGGSYTDSKKITFSGDSLSTAGGSITGDREYSGKGLDYGTTASYQMGGQTRTGVLQNTVLKLTFSGESMSTLSATISSARGNPINMSDYTTNAFTMGGTTGTLQTVIQKMPYSTETMSTLSATLSVARIGNAVVTYHA